jgi:hypothetical protein
MVRHILPFGGVVSDRRLQRSAVDGGHDLPLMFRLLARLQRSVLPLHVNLHWDELLCVEVFGPMYQVLRKQVPFQELLVKETPV